MSILWKRGEPGYFAIGDEVRLRSGSDDMLVVDVMPDLGLVTVARANGREEQIECACLIHTPRPPTHFNCRCRS